MRIRKHANEEFDVLVDPEIAKIFGLTKGSGALKSGITEVERKLNLLASKSGKQLYPKGAR